MLAGAQIADAAGAQSLPWMHQNGEGSSPVLTVGFEGRFDCKARPTAVMKWWRWILPWTRGMELRETLWNAAKCYGA
jgi:hypothetical protein